MTNLSKLSDLKYTLLKCVAGSIFIAISSQISIPLFPVPFTFQTLSVLLIAALLGAELGALTVLLYLLEGICGLPVFANFTCGALTIVGPTGGYLLGFVPAAYITGYLINKFSNRSVLQIFIAGIAGECALFLCGYLQLSCFIGFERAFSLGVVPFCLTDLLKVVIFSLMVKK